MTVDLTDFADGLVQRTADLTGLSTNAVAERIVLSFAAQKAAVAAVTGAFDGHPEFDADIQADTAFATFSTYYTEAFTELSADQDGKRFIEDLLGAALTDRVRGLCESWGISAQEVLRAAAEFMPTREAWEAMAVSLDDFERDMLRAGKTEKAAIAERWRKTVGLPPVIRVPSGGGN